MRNEIKRLQSEVETLRRRLDQRPVVQTNKDGRDILVLAIDVGNALETGQDGILYATSPVTSVPSAYDPTVTSSFIDGIGRGYLYINGSVQDDMVLIVNDGSGTFTNALVEGDRIYSGGAKSIPVSGGGAVSAYVAG